MVAVVRQAGAVGDIVGIVSRRLRIRSTIPEESWPWAPTVPTRATAVRGDYGTGSKYLENVPTSLWLRWAAVKYVGVQDAVWKESACHRIVIPRIVVRKAWGKLGSHV